MNPGGRERRRQGRWWSWHPARQRPRPRCRGRCRGGPDPRGAHPGAADRARCQDRRGLRGAAPAARRGAEGRVHPDGGPRPAPVDAGRVRLHGGVQLRVGDADERRRAHPEGPGPRHRRAGRPGVVEDIVDSGLTLQYLLRSLRARNPASLEVLALLSKPDRSRVDLPIRYSGFEVPNVFVVGYGLDHAERYRNLPYVATLRPGAISRHDGEPGRVTGTGDRDG